MTTEILLFVSLDQFKQSVKDRFSEPSYMPSYTVTTLPSVTTFANCLIYVSNETGGAVPAFSDGTNWRRVTDRAIVS